MRKFIGAFLFYLAMLQSSVAQVTNIRDTTINAKLLQFGYAFQIPFADMADRFGSNNNIGVGLSFKMARNYMLGFDVGFLFGGNIKEDTILNGLFTQQGFLLGSTGLAESVILFERGFSFQGRFGKLFPLFHSNPNSGLNVMAGVGFLQHQIKIEDPNKTVPYVDGVYAKGYDRLTNGLCISQYVGWLHLDERRLKNFNAGIEMMEAFTQNRRDYNFDQMKKDDSRRLDVLLSLRLSWILPFYGGGQERFYTH